MERVKLSGVCLICKVRAFRAGNLLDRHTLSRCEHTCSMQAGDDFERRMVMLNGA